MAHGLLVNQGNGFSRGGKCTWVERRYGLIPIFLTSDVDRIVNEQLTPSFIRSNDMQIIEVDCSNNTLFDERNLCNCHVDFSKQWFTFVSFESIDRSKLKHIGSVMDYLNR